MRFAGIRAMTHFSDNWGYRISWEAQRGSKRAGYFGVKL